MQKAQTRNHTHTQLFGPTSTHVRMFTPTHAATFGCGAVSPQALTWTPARGNRPAEVARAWPWSWGRGSKGRTRARRGPGNPQTRSLRIKIHPGAQRGVIQGP